MRHNSSNRRSRGRGNGRGRGGNNNRSQVFDSNGPEVRIRGTAHQICDKYIALAKDAQSSGDKVLAESYLQHAEHYQRIILSWNEQNDAQNQQKQEHSKNKDVNGNKKEDLSLPGSILGDKVEVSNEQKQADADMLENA